MKGNTRYLTCGHYLFSQKNLLYNSLPNFCQKYLLGSILCEWHQAGVLLLLAFKICQMWETHNTNVTLKTWGRKALIRADIPVLPDKDYNYWYQVGQDSLGYFEGHWNFSCILTFHSFIPIFSGTLTILCRTQNPGWKR